MARRQLCIGSFIDVTLRYTVYSVYRYSYAVCIVYTIIAKLYVTVRTMLDNPTEIIKY